MPIPERIPEAEDAAAVCELGRRWMIDHRLAQGLARMARELPYPLQIISGYRSAETQAGLIAAGGPAATEETSTHRSCPATGADVWTPTVTPVTAVRAAVGAAAVHAGLRWGGGSRVDPGTGIPIDWNHVDLGPRVR